MNSYKKLCAEFYDIDKPKPSRESFEFYLRYAKKAKGPILEPMCGSGRILLPLLEEGFPVDGVDASENMLAACRKKADLRGLTPKLFKQFLHQLELPTRYQLVMIPVGSFCLITDPFQIQESLRRLHAHMLPGATFVVEIERLMPQMPLEEPWSGRWVSRPDGAKIVISRLTRYDPAGQISKSLHRYELIKDERLLETEWEEFDIRFYEIGEFEKVLEAAGFTVVKVMKPYENIAPHDTDDSVVFECIRP